MNMENAPKVEGTSSGTSALSVEFRPTHAASSREVAPGTEG